jgi:hypothetical protein
MLAEKRVLVSALVLGCFGACTSTVATTPAPDTSDASMLDDASTALDSNANVDVTVTQSTPRRKNELVDATIVDGWIQEAATDAAADGGDAGSMAMMIDGGDAGPPAVRFVGRWDTNDPVGPRAAWPGTKAVARFDGTGATVVLSQSDGFSGGPSYFNVVVDGVVSAMPLVVMGFGGTYTLAQNLAPGVHSLELEKRTEANLGTVRFEGFSFSGGSGLLSPPPSRPRTIEFMSNSAIDGYGILGDRTLCAATDPPATNDSRQSFGFATAEGVGTDMMLSAYSGKGILVNEDPTDTDYYPIIWPRTLPEQSWSTWGFSTIPDAVVMVLGGVDMEALAAAPPGFQAAYDAFITTVRTHYPDAFIWLLLWSQYKGAERSAMDGVLSSIVASHKNAGDARIFEYVLPESSTADDSGCEGHANASHEQAMASLMVGEIRARTGW